MRTIITSLATMIVVFSAALSQDTVTIIPEETQEAFKNPLKGFRGKDPDHEL